MKTQTLGAGAAAALILTLGWLAMRDGGTGGGVPIDDRAVAIDAAAVGEAGEALESGPGADRGEPRELVRSPDVAASPREAPAAPDGRARVGGRFVLPGGAPAAEVRLELICHGAREQGIPSRTERGMSAADGAFELAFEPGDARSFSMSARLAGYGTLHWRWPEIDPGERKDLGEIPLSPGATLIARVVDGEGEPLADGWNVRLEQPGSYFGPSGSTRDGRGEVRFPDLLAGRYRLEASLREGPRIPPRRVDLAPGETALVELIPEVDDRIVVEVEPRGRGRLPAAGAFVLRGEGRELRSAIDRRFDSWHVFEGLGPGEYTVELDDERFEPWSRSGLRPGARPIATLRATSSIVLEVTESATGQPIEDYGADLWITVPELDEDGNVRSIGRSGGPIRKLGEAWPEGGIHGDLWPGDWTVAVDAPGFARAEVGFELSLGEQRAVRVELERGARVVGVLVDARSAPIPDASIQLLDPAKGGPIQEHRLLGRPGSFGLPARSHGATTDAEGRFALDGIEPGTWALFGFADRWLSAVLSPFELAAGEERAVRLRLPAGAHLRGRVLGPVAPGAAGHGPDSLALHVEPAGRRPPEGADPIRFPIAPDGTFRSGPLPPGPAILSVSVAPAPAQDQDLGWHRHLVELRRIELVEGEEHELELDLAAHWPGELLVRLEGAPGYSALARRPGLAHASARAAPGPGGVARLGPLLPGDYELLAFLPKGPGKAEHPGLVTLGPGERIERTIGVREVAGTLELVSATTGEPLAGVTAWIPGGGPWMAGLAADSEGRLPLELPPGRYRLITPERTSSKGSVPFDWTDSGPVPARLAVEP